MVNLNLSGQIKCLAVLQIYSAGNRKCGGKKAHKLALFLINSTCHDPGGVFHLFSHKMLAAASPAADQFD